ncbi:MAG TPA: vitamin K epoxide reductase family protein [Terracidiphilus sp.]|nr:vitamin K epoxide reductase family protein [Terracidiphilus sp.]
MRYVLAILALAGAVASGLALQAHYSTAVLPCSINAHWDCGIVNHSPFAMMGKVPVAAVGIVGYLALLAMALLRRRFLLLLSVFAAFCFALRLTMIEQYVLEVWCLYCVISQGIISLMLLGSLGWFGAEYEGLKRAAKANAAKS